MSVVSADIQRRDRTDAVDSIPFRWRATACVSRLWRWEFWPTSLMYAPIIPILAWFAIRHRSATVWTAANPGIAHGGVVGERKTDILAMLPPEHTLPFALIDAVGPAARARQFREIVLARGWSFPMVLKPNAGERGAGFRVVRDDACALAALAEHDEELVAQPFHPGPHEAGVFYYRHPGSNRGRVFSITLKEFPSVVGDGESSLRRLIWAHPRYRMQAKRFLDRLGPRAEDVPELDERVVLAMAGNHCQGTLFRDGERLITPALIEAFDAIARGVDGFFFGRFDVRFEREEEFAAGRGFSIIELNGVLSESTNIYDPGRTLWAAWRGLTQQWRLAFEIGAANAAKGAAVTPADQLVRLVVHHSRRAISELAD